MREIRLYQEDSFSSGSVILSSRNQHYLKKVLRSPEANIILFNGDGLEYLATLAKHKNTIIATITSTRVNNREPKIHTTLVQAIAKSDKMDYVVQKATELGVSAIIPIMSQRVIVKLTPAKASKKREHWQEIAVNAAEQSGRAIVPYIGEIQQIEDLIIDTQSVRYVLDPLASFTLLDYTHKSGYKEPESITGVIGPEGGLTPVEMRTLTDKGFAPLSLGKRILRTETASVSLLSNIELLYGL